MKKPSSAAAFGALLALLMTVGLFAVSTAMNLPLGSSSQIPAAQGQVSMNRTKNENVRIKLKVKHLAPPGHVTPGALVYVVWARGLAAGSEAQNLGALKVDKNLNGKLTAVTAMPAFDLFVTCEQSQTTTVPSTPELLPVHYMGK
jgi:hypothetical protein